MMILVVLLYMLVLPYIGLMLMVIVGMYRSQRRVHNETTPSVTVIIPAHNEEDCLADTLSSLSKQKYDGALEFVIVDDRSVDRTADIIRDFVALDDRFRLVQVTAPSRRLAPKVNAVNTGIQQSSGEIILASDADCQYPEAWVSGMVSHFEEDVAMVVGYVESTRAYDNAGPVQRFESTDWLSLMMTSKSLTHFGWKFASSANNQGYRRSAFEAIGGFGSSGRAPSGDEDLLTQRMGRLPNMRIVFASSPEVSVLTQPMPTLGSFIKQRRRWASRYRHTVHYHPAFWLSIACLGFQSIMLSLMILVSLVYWPLAPYVFGLWAVKLAVEVFGMNIGTKVFRRRDLWWQSTLLWALLHPFFIATISSLALLRSGEWRAGARSYRKRLAKRQIRELSRKVKSAFESD